MNNRRDQFRNEQYDRDLNRSSGRGADDWRSDSMRTGWGRDGGDQQRFGGGREGYGGDWRTEGLGNNSEWQQQGGPRYGAGIREGSGYGYGYGEGMRGGYSYGSETSRGGGGNIGTRRFGNESAASDANARGYGVGSAFERGGGVQVSHRGKGPKGFKRSDERIKELVSEALSDHHFLDASEIELTVKDGEVTLTGTVEDRGLKRLAEDIVEAVPGVLDVHNTLRIAGAAEPSARPNMPAPRSQH